MPLEIKEVVIKTTVNSGDDRSNKADRPLTDVSDSSAVDIQKIVSECVDQVLEILKNKSER